MELLDRYIYDIGRRLPAKQREDIQKELKSLLLDSLDARTGGGEPTQADIAAVIKEFGSPTDVAARYTGQQYLIGPALFPTYLMVMKIVLAAMSFGLFISFFINYAIEVGSNANMVAHLAEFIALMFSSALGAIGTVTIIFAIIERTAEKQSIGKGFLDGSWDPLKLPPIPNRKDEYKPAESIVAIVFIIIGMAVFNLFPGIVAGYATNGPEGWQTFQLFSPEALAAYLPLWNAGWALTLALHVTLLSQGRRSFGTNIAEVALQLYSIGVLLFMLVGPSLLSAQIMQIFDKVSSETMGFMHSFLYLQFRWVFLIAILGTFVGMIKNIVRIVSAKY